MTKYRPRMVDRLLERKLRGVGAVLIEGPKWCGKTTTAEQVAESILYMDDPDHIGANLTMAQISPRTLLQGAKPRLIDEWQLAPHLWDVIRYEVDHDEHDGLFILTGSSVPLNEEEEAKAIHHSGTGRIVRLKMRPMSLYESGDSDGAVSLAGLFEAPDAIAGQCECSLEDMAYLICRGGWPKASMQPKDIALDRASEYYDSIVNVDISRADKVQKNPGRVKRLMRSYARHQGTQTSISQICADMQTNDQSSLDEKTAVSYLEALRKIFVIEDVTAWNPNLRSKTAIRTSDTRYFIDPSIAAAALGLGPKDLINDLNTMGFMFETLCIRDLKAFAQALDGEIYHYRDKKGLECDAVIHLRKGDYGLIEIKLGGETLINEGASVLSELKNEIDTVKMKAPSFLMVLTAIGKYAYRRQDGVYVVPAGCLKD